MCAAWFPNTLATAGAVIQYNLAVAFAIRGELDKAGETLKQVSSADLFPTLLLKTSVCDTCSPLPAEHCPSSTFLHISLPPYLLYKISSAILVDQFYFYCINPYPTAFPYGNGMVLHFYQQQESSTTKTVHKVINRGLKAYV